MKVDWRGDNYIKFPLKNLSPAWSGIVNAYATA
jgi:hypothetical protein